MKKLNHISICFLIAGSYTPFLLIFLFDSFGITLLSVFWGLAVLGIFFKLFFTGRHNLISVVIYLLMGWILLAGGRRFFNLVPTDVMIFIVTGGVLYTLGILFYLRKGFGWNHAAWPFLYQPLLFAITSVFYSLFSFVTSCQITIIFRNQSEVEAI